MDEKAIQKQNGDSEVKAVNSRKAVYKNLLIVGVMQLLSYAAINPTVALVTTTAGKTLGNITFGFNYIFSCLFSFLTVCMLDKETSDKKVLAVGNACIVGFTACNWYVSYYTLIPGTILFGIGVSSSWIAGLTYVKKLSVNYTKKYNLNEQHITSLFVGIVLGFSFAGYLMGNATTSGVLILFKQNYNENDTAPSEQLRNVTNHKECHTNDDKLELSFITMNVLRGTIVCFSVLGFIIILLFLDDLEKKSLEITFQPRLILHSLVKNVCLSVTPVLDLFVRREMMISIPLFITVGASITFAFARYTKVS